MDGVTLLDFAPRARYSKCFLPSCARNVRSWNNRQKSFSYKKKLWNILKSKARLLIWARIFQYSDYKLLDLGSNLKRGYCVSKCCILRHSYKKNTTSTNQIFFFSFKYIFLLAITSKTNKKKGITVLVSLQRQQKGQFRLQMGILRAGTGASFKPNTILARECQNHN